ncbi:MAG: hypothetical protein ACT4NX_01775 [Deltaproteobacteria bacterium]
MRKLLYILPIILLIGCIQSPPPKPIIIPPQKPRTPPAVKPLKPNDVFDASYAAVWSATLLGLKWVKWPPAFSSEAQGLITLREAYVYRSSGKLRRVHRFPTKEEIAASRIPDYLAKVSRGAYGASVPFTQEFMEVRFVKISESKTQVKITYSVKPYIGAGKFGRGLKSSGYIESLLLERIRGTLVGKTVAAAEILDIE